MRKLYLFFLMSFSFLGETQEMSNDYLSSLPDDIKNDVMKRVDEKNELEEEVYRSINSSSDAQKIGFEDSIFGADFFNSFQTSFMPINMPNLDNEYILDFGDVLSIQLIGQKESIDSFAIERDGSINLPDIGKLYLSGLSFGNASEMIIANINQTYIGVDAFVSIENIRDISVLVSGNAFSPGVYTLSGAANMLHALHAAGGISEYGSYRSIKLVRDEKVIDTIDIYDILIHGKFSSKTRLSSGDMIFVEPRSNVITLEGAFKRPADYELLEGQNIADAIFYANGLTVDVDLSNIYLHRLLDGKVEDIAISNISQFKDIIAKDKDRLFVRKHSFRDVKIAGAVLRPGSYKMTEGESIYDLVEKAGGYTQNAFPEGAIYLNEEAKTIDKKAADRLYNQFIDGMLNALQKSSAGSSDISSLVAFASELKNVEPNGRIVIDIKNDDETNLLKHKDSIFIPEKSNNVYIYGEILNKGSLIYKHGADLDFYLQEASGTKETADNSSIFILYPNGRTSQFSRKRNLFASQQTNIEIPPGSVIYVPRKIDDSLSTRLTAQAYATILGNIGVTLASISAIQNNN